MSKHQQAEIATFVRVHGLTTLDACELAGLPVTELGALHEPLEWLPLPADIERMTKQIQLGDVVLNHERSGSWGKQVAERDRMSKSEQQQRDAFDLAGDLDDDAVVVPPWLGSAGR